MVAGPRFTDQAVGSPRPPYLRQRALHEFRSSLGWVSDEPLTSFSFLYAGGIDIKGSDWGRPRDHLGVGLAYLSGGNDGTIRARALEVYYRFVISSYLEITPDVQYMVDDLVGGDGPAGFILGPRMTTRF